MFYLKWFVQFLWHCNCTSYAFFSVFIANVSVSISFGRHYFRFRNRFCYWNITGCCTAERHHKHWTARVALCWHVLLCSGETSQTLNGTSDTVLACVVVQRRDITNTEQHEWHCVGVCCCAAERHHKHWTALVFWRGLLHLTPTQPWTKWPKTLRETNGLRLLDRLTNQSCL